MPTPDPEVLNFQNDFSNEALSGFPVFPLIHIIRKDVEINVGSSLADLLVCGMTHLCDQRHGSQLVVSTIRLDDLIHRPSPHLLLQTNCQHNFAVPLTVLS